MESGRRKGQSRPSIRTETIFSTCLQVRVFWMNVVRSRLFKLFYRHQCSGRTALTLNLSPVCHSNNFLQLKMPPRQWGPFLERSPVLQKEAFFWIQKKILDPKKGFSGHEFVPPTLSKKCDKVIFRRLPPEVKITRKQGKITQITRKQGKITLKWAIIPCFTVYFWGYFKRPENENNLLRLKIAQKDS